MKYFQLFFYLVFLILIASCNDKPIKTCEATIYISQCNSDSKDCIIDMIQPQKDEDTILVMNPITFVRVDKNNETFQADYMTKELNFKKISPILREFKNYYIKSNQLDSIFLSQSSNSVNLDQLNLPYNFIYSCNKVENDNKTINSPEKIQKEISKSITPESNKVAILVKSNSQTITKTQPTTPQNNISVVSQENQKPVNNTNLKRQKEDYSKSQPTYTESSSPCLNKISGNSLEDCFKKLADLSIPRECKSSLKNQTIGYFDNPSCRVVNVDNNGARINGEWTISSYCDRLMTTGRPTFIYEKEMDGSKISTLKINK